MPEEPFDSRHRNSQDLYSEFFILFTTQPNSQTFYTQNSNSPLKESSIPRWKVGIITISVLLAIIIILVTIYFVVQHIFRKEKSTKLLSPGIEDNASVVNVAFQTSVEKQKEIAPYEVQETFDNHIIADNHLRSPAQYECAVQENTTPDYRKRQPPKPLAKPAISAKRRAIIIGQNLSPFLFLGDNTPTPNESQVLAYHSKAIQGNNCTRNSIVPKQNLPNTTSCANRNKNKQRRIDTDKILEGRHYQRSKSDTKLDFQVTTENETKF